MNQLNDNAEDFAFSKRKTAHEVSYQGRSLINFFHRIRLNQTLKLIHKYRSPLLAGPTKWADFGCSNGFIIEQYLQRYPEEPIQISGFDYLHTYVEMARKKALTGVTFSQLDLCGNSVPTELHQQFTLASCFETLEHVRHFDNALDNLVSMIRAQGILLVTVPVEIGFVGVLKFVFRSLLRKNPHGNFFQKKSAFSYFINLLTFAKISDFRDASKTEYGPHLGFDYRELKSYLIDKERAGQIKVINYGFMSLFLTYYIIIKVI